VAVVMGPVAPFLVLGSMPLAWAQNSFPVSGNVGIGTTSLAARLDVAGDAVVDGNITAKYQDVAEWVLSKSTLAPGTVGVINPQERDRALPAGKPYDTQVAGVVSACAGTLVGKALEPLRRTEGQGEILELLTLQ